MDIEKIIDVFDDILKDYEKSETYSILFYSTNFNRDFNLLRDRVVNYKSRLNKVLADGIKGTKQTRDNLREKDIQKELL